MPVSRSCLMKSHCLERSSKTGAVGFVKEANGLFAACCVGFRVAMLSAGVAKRDGGFGPDFDHMTLMVTLAERCWWTSASVIHFEPLLLDSRDECRECARFASSKTSINRSFRRDNGGDWYPLASPCNPTHSPITNRCATSTRPLPNPTSPKPSSALATADGRITLTGLRLITTSAQQRLKTRSRTATRSTTSSAINSAS